jgi:hypothetical protein
MRRHQRTPLVQTVKEENKPVEIEDLGEEKCNSTTDYKTPSPNEALSGPYPVPNSECGGTMYIPLIKNVISEREMMWKDGYSFNNITSSDGLNNYIRPACHKVSPLPGQDAPDKFNRVYKNNSYITILGDGAVYSFEKDGNDRRFSHQDNLTTVTSRLAIVYGGADYGLTIILRLIDDRIENPAGPDDPQVVSYDPRCDVYKTTRGGWWNNFKNWGGDEFGAPLNLALKGGAYLMYTWNVLNDAGINVLLYFATKHVDHND